MCLYYHFGKRAYAQSFKQQVFVLCNQSSPQIYSYYLVGSKIEALSGSNGHVVGLSHVYVVFIILALLCK